MATSDTRNNVAEQRNVTTPIVYEERAACAVRTIVSGPHADKLTARIFGCSVRMAQLLRGGKGWTIQRLSQASAVLGVAFDRALYTPVSSAHHYSEMGEIADRLARLEACFAEMARGGDAGLAPGEGASDHGGNDVVEPRGTVGRDAGASEASRGNGLELAAPVRAMGRS